MDRHWADQMFVDHSDIYLRFLEAGIPQAAQEVASLHTLLAKHQIASGSRILDLSCGIGRHSIELAKLGYKMTGFDLSPMFIERAKQLAQEREVSSRINFCVGDARNIAEVLKNSCFDAIINIFTSFGYYDEPTNIDILKQCHSLIRENGVFIMDVINRDGLVKRYSPRSYSHFGDILLLQNRKVNYETGRNITTWIFHKETSSGNYQKELEITIDHRIYNLHELIGVFAQAGWAYREVFGNLNLESFDMTSTRIVGVFGA